MTDLKENLPARLTRRQVIVGVAGAGVAAIAVATGIPQEFLKSKDEEPVPQGEFLFMHQELGNPKGDYLFTWDIITNKPREIYNPQKAESFSNVVISSDHTKVALFATEKADPSSGSTLWKPIGIKIIEVKTGDVTQTIKVNDIRSLRWTQEGNNLVYTTQESQDKPDTTINIYSTEKKKLIRELTLPIQVFDFSVSPKDNNVIAARININGIPQTAVIDISLDKPKTLALFESVEEAQWSPDGTKIAYSRKDANSSTLVVLDVNQDKIVTEVKDAFIPCWSQDGNVIAFTKNVGPTIGNQLVQRLPDGDVKKQIGRSTASSPARLARLDLTTGSVNWIGKDPLEADGTPPFAYTWLSKDWVVASNTTPGIEGESVVMVNQKEGKPIKIFPGLNQDFPLAWLPVSK